MKTPAGWIVAIVSCALVVSLAACSGKDVRPDEDPMSPDAWYERTSEDIPLAQAYRNIVVQYSTTDELQRDYPDMLRRVESSTLDRLRILGGFAGVGTDRSDGQGGEDTLIVQAHIPDMRIVSSAARIWGGVLVGASYMNVDVKLIDGQSGEVMREKHLSSTVNPYAASWAWGSTDRSLDDDMGRIVADYIRAVAR